VFEKKERDDFDGHDLAEAFLALPHSNLETTLD
jgi:hypothetical protein